MRDSYAVRPDPTYLSLTKTCRHDLGSLYTPAPECPEHLCRPLPLDALHQGPLLPHCAAQRSVPPQSLPHYAAIRLPHADLLLRYKDRCNRTAQQAQSITPCDLLSNMHAAERG